MAEQEVKKNIFTEEGRLLQAEFAIKNVSEAGTIVGCSFSDGAVLIGVNNVKTTNLEKVYQVNKTTFVAVSGIFSDALRLLRFSRVKSVQLKQELGVLPKVSVLCEMLAMEMQYYTQNIQARPFGVCFLFAGYEEGKFIVQSIDPSGTINRWKACCFGSSEDVISSGLRNNLQSLDCNVEDGLYNTLKILSNAKEWSADFTSKLEIFILYKDGHRMVSVEEINGILSRIERKKSNQ